MKFAKPTLFLAAFLVGTGIGIFAADAVWWHKSSGVGGWIESMPPVAAVMYTPAFWLFTASHALGIGPSGDAAWGMVPWCIIVYWAILGLIVGVSLRWLIGRRHKAP